MPWLSPQRDPLPTDSPGGAVATDVQLIERMTRGDRAALAELYGRHVRTLLAVATHIVHSRPEAEDVVQDVFLEAFRHCGEYSGGRASVRTWLLVRTRSRALDRVRSSGRRRHVLHHVAQQAAQPVDEAQDLGDHSRLRTIVPRMPEAQRQVIELGYFAGMTTVEIAARLGVPAGTVKSRTRAALATLRELLGMADG